MILQILLLCLGFVFLVKGADFFVNGAAGIAAKLGIPQLIVGLTIVAMGTSLPEAAVSITSGLKGNAGITIGNVVSTDPEAGTSVKAGDTVTLTISIGEGDTAVRVPNVIGTSEADAKSTLSQLGLLVSVQTGNDQSVNEGEVYKQSVDSGTRVNTGETITIYVRSSSSSDDEDSEDSKTDKDKNKDKDKNSSSSSDGTWKPANSLQQPTNYQGGKVKVELVQTDDDGNTYDFANGEDVYDENGVDYYYHGEPAYVRYMPKNQ